MLREPFRAPDPLAGYHRIASTRRFRYLTPDLDRRLTQGWTPVVLACPSCPLDTGLTLVLDQSGGRDHGALVQAACPAGHAWDDPRVDPAQFAAYSKTRFGLNDDGYWLIEAGFGEEPPPPVDIAHDLAQGLKHTYRYGIREAKKAGRRTARKTRRGILRTAGRPLTAVRTALGLAKPPTSQTPKPAAAEGGTAEPAAPAPRRIPRRAPAPADAARVVNTGTIISSVTAADGRVQEVRITGGRATIDGQPAAVGDPRVRQARAAQQAAANAAKGRRIPGGAQQNTVTVHGKNNAPIQSTGPVTVHGAPAPPRRPTRPGGPGSTVPVQVVAGTGNQASQTGADSPAEPTR